MRAYIDLFETAINPEFAPAITNLKKKGWSVLRDGVGKFGVVLHHRDKDYVIKLFLREDTAYRAFLEMAKGNPNQHFPKIFGNIVDVTHQIAAVRLEPLSPGTRSAIKPVAMFKFCHLTGLFMEEFASTGVQDKDTLAYIESQSPYLKDACVLMATKLLSRFNLDLETKNNVMLRGSTFVYSDPVANALE